MDLFSLLYLVSSAAEIATLPGEDAQRAGLATTGISTRAGWLVIGGVLLFVLGFGYYFVDGQFR